MGKLSDEAVIRNIFQMLFEMATGNLHYRIRVTIANPELENISSGICGIAQKMQSAFLKYRFANPIYSYQNLVQLYIMVDLQDNICDVAGDTFSTIGYHPKDLAGLRLRCILDKQSAALWQQISLEAVATPLFHTTIQLMFLTPDNALHPSYCTVSRLYPGDKIMIGTITTELQEIIYNFSRNDSKRIKKAAADNIETLQAVYHYILDHLDEPLPAAKQLSQKFGINEFDLKNGFHDLFKTSIYHFYNEERLKRAHHMITGTNLALKVIAILAGFDSYPGFYKAFRAKYGYVPGRLKRPSEIQESGDDAIS